MLLLLDGNIVFDTVKRELYDRAQDRRTAIGANEAGILLMLIEADGKVYNREDMIEEVWRRQRGIEVNESSVSQAISGLRKLLGDSAQSPKMILTVPRKGYVLAANVSVSRLLSPTVEATNSTAEERAVEDQRAADRKRKRWSLPSLSWLVVGLVWLLLLAAIGYRYVSIPRSQPTQLIKLGDALSVPVYYYGEQRVSPNLYPLIVKCVKRRMLSSDDEVERVMVSAYHEASLSLVFYYHDPQQQVSVLQVGINQALAPGSNECGN